MLLDRFGREIEVQHVRRSLGFVSQLLAHHDDDDSISGVRPLATPRVSLGDADHDDPIA